MTEKSKRWPNPPVAPRNERGPMTATDEFERMLAEKWAVERTDIYVNGIGEPSLVRASSPMRPDAVMTFLAVSKDELVELLRTGVLGRPGRRSGGRVAWRRDEVEVIADNWRREV